MKRPAKTTPTSKFWVPTYLHTEKHQVRVGTRRRNVSGKHITVVKFGGNRGGTPSHPARYPWTNGHLQFFPERRRRSLALRALRKAIQYGGVPLTRYTRPHTGKFCTRDEHYKPFLDDPVEDLRNDMAARDDEPGYVYQSAVSYDVGFASDKTAKKFENWAANTLLTHG
jgi:hypothetical protein